MVRYHFVREGVSVNRKTLSSTARVTAEYTSSSQLAGITYYGVGGERIMSINPAGGVFFLLTISMMLLMR